MSPYPRHLAVLLAFAIAAAVQAQYPDEPEAAVVKYSVWDPEDPADLTDGKWQWDPGIDSTDSIWYFDHDRDAADDGVVHMYRWGDHVQITIEASLPINYDAPDESGSIEIPFHNLATHIDMFAAGDEIPPGVTVQGVTVIGAVRYIHTTWTQPSEWFPCVFPNPVPAPYGGDDPSWEFVYDAGPGSPITGINWNTNNDGVGNDGWTHFLVPTLGGHFWVQADGEPGGPSVTDTYWTDPTNGGEWRWEFSSSYVVYWTLGGGGDVLYPNPTQVSPLPVTSRLDPDNLVVDWIDPADTNPAPNTALNDALTNDPLRGYINPLFLQEDPNSELQITSASIELVGPDLDPYTEGHQGPRWTITNGRLASAVDSSSITGDANLPSSWKDMDGTTVARWDSRIGNPASIDADFVPLDASWKRVVRLVFGGTGYPGTRGFDPATSDTHEGLYGWMDDPDALRIGPSPGLKLLSTRAEEYLYTATDVFGLLPADRRFTEDPGAGDPASTDPADPYYDASHGRMDNPWTPGAWTVANLTMTISPDPEHTDDPNSYRTVVIPVHPKAPWDVPSPNGGGPLDDDEKARNWFVVENPIDVQIARGDKGSATEPDYDDDEIGSGRFGTLGNPGTHDDKAPADTAVGDAQHRYFLANGNRDFPSIVESLGSEIASNSWDERYFFDPDGASGSDYETAGWRWLTFDHDGDPATNGAPLPGWCLPLIDLDAGTAGSAVGYVRSGENRADDGLWISNLAHMDLEREITTVTVQTDAQPVSWETPDTALRQDIGPGVVRVEIPPLRPVIVQSDNYTADPPLVEFVTRTAVDYMGRSLPNGSYPSIPGSALRLQAAGADLARQGLPTVPWDRSNDDRTEPTSLSTPWAAYDERDSSGNNHEFRATADTLDPQRVSITLQIPEHQPPLASATDDGDWRLPSDYLEVLGTDEPPVGFYGTLDPDDATVPDYSGPGSGVTDYQSGSATLSYALNGQSRSEEDYMVKVYVDVNNNGRLDLAQVARADAAYGTGPSDPDHDPFWYRFLYEEPYRVVPIRVKVLPDYEVAPGRRVADGGIYGHADPRSWHTLPERDLRIESRGNMPAGVLPVGRPAGTPGLLSIGATSLNPFQSDDTEQGVLLPVERMLPNYIFDGDPNTTGWSVLPAPAGSSEHATGIFVDGANGFPINGAPDEDPATGESEFVGSKVLVNAFAAGTPMGTYWLDLLTYVDFDGEVGFNPAIDQVSTQGTKVKATIKESPIPPIVPTASREIDKDAPWTGPGDPPPANANSTFAELGPAFFVNTWDVEPGTVIPRVLHGAQDGRYGDTAIYFTSNRPSDEPAVAIQPQVAWNLWGQVIDHVWGDPAEPYRPVNPTFQPDRDSFLIAGHPLGADGSVGGGGADSDFVSPPEPRFSGVAAYRHMTPSLVRQTVLGPDTPPVVVMSWALEVDWLEDSSAPNPETIRTYHLGVAVLQSQDGFLGLPQAMGEPLFGPMFIDLEGTAAFGPRPLVIPDPDEAGAFDVYMYYYTGSGSQRRLAYALWRVAVSGTEAGLRYEGSHELPVMTRYAPDGVRLDGLQYAKDPFLFADVWFGIDAVSGDEGWAGGPNSDFPNDIGVVFSGRSTSFGTEDIFYTRYDPEIATNPNYDPGTPGSEPWTLSQPALYNPTNNNTGQIAFPEQTAAPLVPLRQEAIAAGQTPGNRHFRSYASERWVDWIYDRPAGLEFAIYVNGGVVAGPGDWLEDPITGYLFAENAGGGRTVEVDPTVGMVRFVDEALVPGETDAVTADFIPQTMRLTRASQDSAQPHVALLPPEVMSIPYTEATSTAAGTGRMVRTDVELPLRMVLLYKRHDAQGRMRLLYETFSMPFTAPSATAPGGEQLFWQKVSDPAEGASRWGHPVIHYPIDGGTEAIPFYVDRQATHVPLDEATGELYVSAQPVRYVWYTDARNTNLSDPATMGRVPAFAELGSTLNITGGPLGNQTLQQVVGPTVLWLMYSSTAEKTAEGEVWQDEEWAVAGTGDGGVGFLYEADWDLYFGVLSPQAIPRTTVYDAAGQS